MAPQQNNTHHIVQITAAYEVEPSLMNEGNTFVSSLALYIYTVYKYKKTDMTTYALLSSASCNFPALTSCRFKKKSNFLPASKCQYSHQHAICLINELWGSRSMVHRQFYIHFYVMSLLMFLQNCKCMALKCNNISVVGCMIFLLLIRDG